MSRRHCTCGRTIHFIGSYRRLGQYSSVPNAFRGAIHTRDLLSTLEGLREPLYWCTSGRLLYYGSPLTMLHVPPHAILSAHHNALCYTKTLRLLTCNNSAICSTFDQTSSLNSDILSALDRSPCHHELMLYADAPSNSPRMTSISARRLETNTSPTSSYGIAGFMTAMDKLGVKYLLNGQGRELSAINWVILTKTAERSCANGMCGRARETAGRRCSMHLRRNEKTQC